MKSLAKTAVLAGAALALAGCSGLDSAEPDVQEVEEELELRRIELPDGREIECIYYSEDGAYASWLAFDCNWEPR